MGEVTVPSGTLTILDPGHIGMFENGDIAEVPAVMVGDLPRDRPFPVRGVRVGEGRWEKLWDRVVIEVRDAPVASSEAVGTVMADYARVWTSTRSSSAAPRPGNSAPSAAGSSPVEYERQQAAA